MLRAVVKAFKHYVFERYTTLTAPVVLTDGMDDFVDWIGLLNRHNLGALIVERTVQTDGQIAFRLVDEAFHVWNHTRR